MGEFPELGVHSKGGCRGHVGLYRNAWFRDYGSIIRTIVLVGHIRPLTSGHYIYFLP